MSLGIRILADELRSLDSASIGASYTAIGTAFDFPMVVLFFQNLTDETILLSFDGITDHLVLPTNGFHLLDVGSNKNATGFALSMAKATTVYAKQESAAPMSGSVYLTAYYIKEI